MLVRDLILNKTSVPLLNKVLNVTSLRHRAVSNNISNVNTVNYKRKDIDFASYLKSVDIDQEMADLAENHLVYNIGSQIISRQFSALKKSISGRIS
jgi:flagellar basal body rod protein FlgB